MAQTDLFWLNFGKILTKWKNSIQKKNFFLVNQVGFSEFCNMLNTVVKEFLTSETMRRVLHFVKFIKRANNMSTLVKPL
jgi:hypothetical protein